MSHVLVVDDEPDVRLMLRLALRVAGHDVDEVGTGADAVRALSDVAYDAVILDIHLPDMSGWEVLDRIRRSPSRAGTPVVVVTADVSQRDRGRERTGAEVRVMFKPLDPDELVAQLESALTSGAA